MIRLHLHKSLLPILLFTMNLTLLACRPIASPPTVVSTPVLVATTLPSTQAIAPSSNPEREEAMNTALIRAAEAGDTPSVLRLLADGADINSRDAHGRTPVMAATHGNQVATVQALIAAGADINLQDNRRIIPSCMLGPKGCWRFSN